MATATTMKSTVPGPHTMNAMQHTTSRASLQTLTSANGQRNRKERPCDGCRRRKSKCVIQEASPCVLCRFHQQDCTFVEAAVPRKRKAEDPATRDASPAKPCVSSERAHCSSPDFDSPKSSKQSPQSGEAALESTTVRHRSTLDRSTGQRADSMALQDDTPSLQSDKHCRYVGRTSALDASLLGLRKFSAVHEARLDSAHVRRVSKDSFFDIMPESNSALVEHERRALEDLGQAVGAYGPTLLDIYFDNIHPSFPILQKQAFLDRQQQIHPALLAGMYVSALSWWPEDASLSQQPMPSTEALGRLGLRSLHIAMQCPSLSALQGGLLLLQRQRSDAWSLTVQLVAMSQELGLHLDCSSWDIPIWERRLRKRLAWALYMQDKWSGLIHGRASHIQARDWAVPQLSRADLDEDVVADDAHYKSDRQHLIFVQMIELTVIMDEVVDTFYTQKALANFAKAGKSVTAMILAKAKPVQLKLKEWYARLPVEARMDSYALGERCSNGSLHLAYFATEVLIHRRIVQSLSITASDPYMLYICRSAAKTRLISALDFVNRLRPEHLDSFWYFASSNNLALIAAFGNLLRATAPGQEEAVFYESRLREYRWALAVSAERAEWIEGAVRILDITNGLLANLPEKQRSGEKRLLSGDAHMSG